jgi:sugar lactone lactonase YvrE
MKNFLISGLFFICTLFLWQCQKGTDQSDSYTYNLVEIAHSDKLWTGVAVSEEGRIFVNYPRWSPEVEISVAEINHSGEPIPYPDKEWNNWIINTPPENCFVCVQSVYIDRDNNLWILDPANPFLQGVIEGGAKLLKFDLHTDLIMQKIYFNSTIAPQTSYLNDIRVDTERGYAYITDSGLGAIIVVDLQSGKSRRFLSRHYSTKAENITLTIEGLELKLKVHSDGLALDADGEYLYYQALTGRRLYRIRTEYLRDPSMVESRIGKYVEYVGESGASDAIAFGKDGYIYLSSLEYNAIRKISPQGELEMVIQDARLKWPDSFAITKDGIIYLTTSQLHLGNMIKEPYRIFRLEKQNSGY